MRVSVELPDAKSDPLLKQLQAQFEALQKQLMGRKQDTPVDMKPLLQMMARQQDALVRAMERMGKLTSKNGNGHDDALLQALRGLKKTLAELPDDLKTALNGSYKRTQDAIVRPRVTVKPEVTVRLGGLNTRLNRMEEALVAAAKRSRSRTFGSNY